MNFLANPILPTYYGKILFAVTPTSLYFSSLKDQIRVQISASEIFSPISSLLVVTLENLLLPVQLTG